MKTYKIKTTGGIAIVQAEHVIHEASGAINLMAGLEMVAKFAPGTWEWIRVTDEVLTLKKAD